MSHPTTAPVAPVVLPPPTMAQTLTQIVTDVAILDGDIRAILAHEPAGPATLAVTTALDAVAGRRAAAAGLAPFTDAAAGEAQYTAVGRLRAELRRLVTAVAAVPALTGKPAIDAAALVTSATTLANLMLPVVVTPRQPQRGRPSVGFEFELPGLYVDTPDIPAKALLARWVPDGGGPAVRLETDGGHAEFVTEPATTPTEVQKQVDVIRRELAKIRRAQDRTVQLAVPEDILSAEDGRVLRAKGFQVTVRHGEGESKGRVQGTAACPLVDLPEMIVMHANGDGVAGFADDPLHPQAVALARVVNYYVLSLERAGAAADHQGPKVLLPVMCRTGLRAMYAALPPAEQVEVQRLLGYGSGTGGVRGRRLVQHGYLGPAGASYQGPLVGEWIDSIVDGRPSTVDTEPVDRDANGDGPRGTPYDLMSPPPGYPAHRRGRHFTYAMGFYGLANDGTALVEVREIWPAGNYSVDNFEAQALEFARQRFETSAARMARLTTRINTEVAAVCQGRAGRTNDAAAVRGRLRDLPPAEFVLAGPLIPAAITAYVPPTPTPPVSLVAKRSADDADGDPTKRVKGDT